MRDWLSPTLQAEVDAKAAELGRLMAQAPNAAIARPLAARSSTVLMWLLGVGVEQVDRGASR